KVIGVDATGVTIETADKGRLTLGLCDPMLSRLDLAYSLNMHMAQGITTDKAITVMSAHERYLSNQRLFNVGVTRVRDELTMVIDDREKIERQLDLNPGNKTSSLETLGRLDIDGRKGPGAQPREKFDPGPIDGVDLSDLPPLPSDLPPLPTGPAPVPDAKDSKAPPDLKPDRADPLPPLPERSLGLDL
ncbi:MAG: AAA family ATPase, partial [Sphingobium sp. 32-64-5]